MNKRLDKLLGELKLESSGDQDMTVAQIRNVKNRANNYLNAIPNEKIIYIRQKIFKSIIVAAVVLTFCITSVLAAVRFEVLEEFFVGDSSFMKQFVKSTHESVSDGQFKLTLEEMLTDNHYVFIVYSIEGLTDDAIKDLMRVDPDNDFMYYDNRDNALCTMSYFPLSDNGWHCYEIVDKRTSSTRYWAYYGVVDNVGEALRLRLNKMSEDLYITVILDSNVEIKELTLTGQPYGDVYIRLSPIGIIMHKGTISEDALARKVTNVVFRMKDGRIKTYNQLASILKTCWSIDKYTDAENREYNRYRYEARFVDAVAVSEFKSIIVENTEYDLNDTAKTNYTALDVSMYPVVVEGVLLENERIGTWLPIQEVCDKLGADMGWDGETLTVTYRGSTVKLKDNSNTYVRDGKTIPYQIPQSSVLCVYEDKLYIISAALQEALCVDVNNGDNPIEYDYEPAEKGDGITETPRTPQYVMYYIIP